MKRADINTFTTAAWKSTLIQLKSDVRLAISATVGLAIPDRISSNVAALISTNGSMDEGFSTAIEVSVPDEGE
jgi:hypothetical protein